MCHTQFSVSVVTSAWLWAVASGAFFGAVGCGDHKNGTTSPHSSSVRTLRDKFPEHAQAVLQQEHSFRKTDVGFILKDPGAEGTWRSVQVELPLDGKQFVRFKTLNGLEIRVREVGIEGPGGIAEQSVSYPRPGGTSYWTTVPGAYEEWLHFEAGAVTSTAAVAVWHIEGVTVRQAGDAVDLLDESGAVQMQVTAPEAYAAKAGTVKARLVGAEGTIELYVDADGEDVLVDPIWGPGGAMTAARAGFTATLLTDGRVLATGGINDSAAQKTAETYNPATNTWSGTANTMASTRRDHAAVLMWNNKVLVTGGWGPIFLNSAEVFDPTTDLWSPTAPMSTERWYHKSVQLGNGKVLVAGGYGGTMPLVTELYDPATGMWANTGDMITARIYHTATLLNNGKVLVAGGEDGYTLGSAELYDPVAGNWTATADMNTPRSHHTATLLNDGKVLVAGGAYLSYLQSAEIYDPVSGAWNSASVGVMSTARYDHTATLLDNGRVLISGGFNGNATVATAEQYNPVTKQFSSAGSSATSRYQQKSVRLQDGKVLVAGGYNNSGSGYLASTEMYLMPLNTSCASNSDCQSDFCVDGLCCNESCGNDDDTDCQVCNAVGSEGSCSPSPPGFVCQAPADICDVAETCDGMATVCPADAFVAMGSICRQIAVGSNCDMVEACTGSSKACPADGFLPAGTSCRAAAAVCDVVDNCTGNSPFCPEDTFVPVGTQCRATAGLCDVAENCDGNGPLCPPDAFVAAGTYCLNGPGLCGPTHACTGSDAECP